MGDEKTDREIAEAATVGPWLPAMLSHGEVGEETHEVFGIVDDQPVQIAQVESVDDSLFIAHFNPAKVREMLAEIETLKSRLEVAESQRDTVSNVANSALAAEHNRRVSRQAGQGWMS